MKNTYVKSTGLYIGKKPVINKDKVLSRIKEIKEEDRNTPKPILGQEVPVNL